jgi:hypothetical protein
VIASAMVHPRATGLGVGYIALSALSVQKLSTKLENQGALQFRSEWPLPTTSIRGQVPLNHRAAIRRLAHTLMLDLGSEIAGVDATPLPARRRAMMRWAQVTCPGSCDGTTFIRTPGGLACVGAAAT